MKASLTSTIFIFWAFECSKLIMYVFLMLSKLRHVRKLFTARIWITAKNYSLMRSKMSIECIVLNNNQSESCFIFYLKLNYVLNTLQWNTEIFKTDIYLIKNFRANWAMIFNFSPVFGNFIIIWLLIFLSIAWNQLFIIFPDFFRISRFIRLLVENKSIWFVKSLLDFG